VKPTCVPTPDLNHDLPVVAGVGRAAAAKQLKDWFSARRL